MTAPRESDYGTPKRLGEKEITLEIDGTEVVGMVSQADIARACPPEKIGELVAAISED